MFAKWFPLLFLLAAGCLAGDILEDGVIAADNRYWFLSAAEPRSSVAPVASFASRGGSPMDTVDRLKAREKELSEPSQQSEEAYVAAIRSWLDTLDPFKRERARKILRDAHPALHNLREAIRAKKAELASISFDKGMKPERLPRLGMELQQLRASLGDELKRVQDRLRAEAGVDMDPVAEDSFWLTPQAQ